MTKTVVLVLLAPDDTDARTFQQAIEADEQLREQIELRFSRSEDADALLLDCDIAVCGNLSPEQLERAADLKWIAFWSAGMDGKFTPQLAARNLILTNASGVHGPNIAEHVMMFMLMFTRNEPFYFRRQIEGEWKRDNWGQEKWNRQPRRSAAQELTGQTLGIVGLGRIGEALAVRAKAFDMHVIATKRNPRERYDATVTVDAVYGMDELPRLLAESDHICVTVPATPENHHLLNAEMLANCKSTAYIYNIGRGSTIDEAALISALDSGQLAGAGLDVFEAEPLPADSLLWQMDNVIITPHVSGITPFYFKRFAELFTANLYQFLQNKPLRNVFNPTKGY